MARAAEDRGAVFSGSERGSFRSRVPSTSQDLVLQGTGPLILSTAQSFSTHSPEFSRFTGDLTTVADPHVSRRRLSRSSNAQQSWLTRAASFLGSISLLACSAMVSQSSES